MVLGTFAYCGSGQDTLADGFCKYLGFTKYCMGDIIREFASARKLPLQRKILQNIRVEINSKYGRNFVPESIVERINKAEKPTNNVIITGIRTIEECSILRGELGMKLIFVYADENIRYLRMLKRKDEKDEENLSELKKRMERENEMFDYVQLQEQALYKFDFNMPLDVYKIIEKNIVQKIYVEMMEKGY